MKKLVIIGFDGTIADTAPGILYCMNTTALSMGYTPVAHDALYGVIGVSLEQGFMKLYGMKEDEIEYAMNQYSKLYSIKGEEMILIYDGIAESLQKLKENGVKLAIATQKNEKFINNMLAVYSYIGCLFDTVCATNVEREMTKTDMLRKVCEDLDVDASDMDFAAALYGWGFRSQEDAAQYNCKAYLNNAGEIAYKLSAL